MLAKDGAQKQLEIVADARAKHSTQKLVNTVADVRTGCVGTVAGSQVSSVGVPAPATSQSRPYSKRRLYTKTSPAVCQTESEQKRSRATASASLTPATSPSIGVPLMAANHTVDNEVGAPDNLFDSQTKSETGVTDDRSDDAVSGRESGRRRKRSSSNAIDRLERAAVAAERRRDIERRRGIGEDAAAMLERDSQASNQSGVRADPDTFGFGTRQRLRQNLEASRRREADSAKQQSPSIPSSLTSSAATGDATAPRLTTDADSRAIASASCSATMSSSIPPQGIPNRGNTCYANSVLQALCASNIFESLRIGSQQTPVESNLCDFRLRLREHGAPSPEAFLSRHTGDQEDAMEFLDQEIFAKCQNLFNACMFTETSTFHCAQCRAFVGDAYAGAREHKYALSVPIRSDDDDVEFNCVEDAVQAYVNAEDIVHTPERCDGCPNPRCQAASQRVETPLKRCKLSGTPSLLIVQCKRFCYEYDGAQLACRLIRHAVHPDRNLNFNGARYSLRSVVSHEGPSLKFGHYVACMNLHGTWWIANDSEVREASAAERRHGCREQGRVYLVMYELEQQPDSC